MQFRVIGDGSFERFQVLVAKLVGDGKHAPLDLFHLGEPDLMNFFGREIGGGALFYEKGVVGLAVGKGRNPGFGAPLRDVLIADERGEAGVSG